MKIKDNEYFCEWFETYFEKEVARHMSGGGAINKGKQNGSAHCVCPSCGRNVSQKTKTEMLGK